MVKCKILGLLVMAIADLEEKPKISPFYDPKIRAFVYQFVMIFLVGYGLYAAYTNAVTGLSKQGVVTSLGFWDSISGFPISFRLIEFTELSSYGTAFWVGLINTVVVSILGIFFATILGFIVGIGLLSKNWLIGKISYWYVQIIRNIPLLILLILLADLMHNLPNAGDIKPSSSGIYLTNQGLFTPRPVFETGSSSIFYALFAGIIGFIGYYFFAKNKQITTGKQSPVGLVFLGLAFVLPIVVFFISGMPVSLAHPVKTRFSFQGDATLQIEFFAALLGLVLYTAAFIAEVVRAGITSVSKGQSEASGALGLTAGQNLRLVVVPQAFRVILPPLTNQYLNLTKNSSLASVIAFPELVQVFAGTVLNQTNQDRKSVV